MERKRYELNWTKQKYINQGKLITAAFLVLILLISVSLNASAEQAELIDRYAIIPEENMIQTMAVEEINDLTASIRKRAEWTNKENGDARITLQYQSNSGSVIGTEDMNVILVHDKSGSMDSNYGFKIQLENEGLAVSQNQGVGYVSAQAGSYSFEEVDRFIDLVTDGRDYTADLNYDGRGFMGGSIVNTEMTFNSPCQLENHYYLLKEDDPLTGFSKGTFVHGNNLYNIYRTDLHHYCLVKTSQEYSAYKSQGRRVIKGTVYYDENGIKHEDAGYYNFVDVSKIVTFNGKTYLSTVDSECEMNDRLSRSQEFMKQLVSDIQKMNENNKIAYIPFWGDVPENGTWENLSSYGSMTELRTETYQPQILYKEGVTSIGLTDSDSFDRILDQIQNPFTYSGTNWTRALQQAVQILNSRSKEDKQKNTLVIFLTDGKPQGFSGKETDVDNKLINGLDQITQLNTMDGVTFYAIGVCINQADTAVIKRLNEADSSGQAAFARNTGEFEALLQNIEQRFNEQYKIDIMGLETFYTDKLSEQYRLDEIQIDKSWIMLESADKELKYGVPQNVYEAAIGCPEAEAVYVKNTNTVYWHIGTMTEGSYDDSGHSLSFPVKYSDYKTVTGGKDIQVESNDIQKLTYVSSANIDKLLTVEMESPCLIFNRSDASSITVEKKLEGWNLKEDRNYRYAICKEEQKGIVKESIRTFTITVRAGESSGKITATDIPAGTYYIYEIDDSGKIQNDGQSIIVSESGGGKENQIILSDASQLLTLSQDQAVPASAVSSASEMLDNYNNYLKIISGNASVIFTETRKTGELTIVKTIDAHDDVIWWEHGNPIFLIRVTGKGTDGKEYTFYHTYEFTKEYVDAGKTADGTCSMAYTFTDIPLSTEYSVEEVKTMRYRLTSVEGNVSTVQILERRDTGQEYYPVYAKVNLKENPEGTEVEFCNEKTNYQWYSHNAYVQNTVSW